MPRTELITEKRGGDSAYVWSLNGRTWAVLPRYDGVPTLEGPTDTPSIGLVCWLFGMSALVLTIPLFAWIIRADWFVLLYTGGVTGTLAVLLLITAVRVIRVRRALAGLRSAPAIARSLRVDEDAVARIAAAHSIRPAFVVNGENRFDPASFQFLETLLRPASAPPADTLLRPAANGSDEIASLVRPSAAPRGDADHVV